MEIPSFDKFSKKDKSEFLEDLGFVTGLEQEYLKIKAIVKMHESKIMSLQPKRGDQEQKSMKTKKQNVNKSLLTLEIKTHQS